MENVRSPQVAGYFYPADSDQLKSELRVLLDISKPVKQYDKIFGLVSPHAGYVYSGKTAAHVYNLLRGKKYKRVVVISPSHSEYFPGVSIYDGDAYATPLGVIEVDKKFADKLVENSKNIFRGIEGHRKEHALEVQLPFLQMVLDDFKIVPIVMGDQGRMFVDELAEKLAEAADNETLIVASSDMSHFHHKSEAYELDSIVEKRINNFDYESLMKDLAKHNTEACGGGPIVAMMKAAALKHKNHSEVVHRSDSSDVTGDENEVVGYLSAVVYGE